jgi:hypothetical protein
MIEDRLQTDRPANREIRLRWTVMAFRAVDLFYRKRDAVTSIRETGGLLDAFGSGVAVW